MSKCGQPIFGENTLHTNEVCCCLSAQEISKQPKWAAAFLANFWTHTAASRLDRHRVGISRFENKSFLQKNEQQKVDPFWKAMEHVSCWQLLQHGSITEWWGGQWYKYTSKKYTIFRDMVTILHCWGFVLKACCSNFYLPRAQSVEKMQWKIPNI